LIILDTNVLSAIMKVPTDRIVLEWFGRQPRSSIWTTAVTVFEIRFGLHIMERGRRRTLLVDAFEAALVMMGGRIASFDAAAAHEAAELMAARQKRGTPVDMRDTMIAGIALAQKATLATRNTAHFEDLSVPVVNPWII
jgi:predicted nucleic acid-binding protein